MGSLFRGRGVGGSLMHVRLRAAMTAALVLTAAGAAGAASAQAADGPFHCQASALRITVAGQQTVEPVTVGTDGGCTNQQGTPTVAVPSLLTAKALTADTNFDAGKSLGTATGGIANLAVVPTPDQIAQLPTEQFISQLPNQTFAAPAPLNATLAALGLPTTLQLDIRDAVRALVPTPGTALVSADILTANASIGCANGSPTLNGSSQLAGVKLLGQDVALTGVLDQVVSLIDTQNIDLSKLDLSKVHIVTPLNGITDPLMASLQAAIGPALAALPPISLPASVVDVKLTPNEQIKNGNSLVQRALHAQVSLLGQPLLDAVFGEALVSGTDRACAAAAQGAVADQILGCSDRKLVLTDVYPIRRGKAVFLQGYANRKYAGRKIAIRLRATGKVIAHAQVKSSGLFKVIAKAPPGKYMTTHRRQNLVRYRAEISGELSRPLKLLRRLRVSSLTSRKGKVTIVGRVIPPLTTPISTIRVVRRVSCHKVVLVGRFKPRNDGTFRIVVKAPKTASAAAVYRLVTSVREKPSNPRRYPTFTLPLGVALNSR